MQSSVLIIITHMKTIYSFEKNVRKAYSYILLYLTQTLVWGGEHGVILYKTQVRRSLLSLPTGSLSSKDLMWADRCKGSYLRQILGNDTERNRTTHVAAI